MPDNFSMSKEIFKTYHHVPPHLYRPQAKYFITASTYKSKRVLNDDAKDRLLNSMAKGCSHYGWILEDWVILDNHYHIMLEAPKSASSLSDLIRDIHRFTGLWIKKNIPDSSDLPRVFQNYWDTCITYEKSYYARLNYIYYNPVKHGYVNNANDYPYSSYRTRIAEKGQRELLKLMKQKYPFDRINVKDDF